MNKELIPIKLVMLLLLLLGFFYAFRGMTMHSQFAVENAMLEDMFVAYADEMLGDDAASGDWFTNDRLLLLQQSLLVGTKLVSIGQLLTGIFFILVAILMVLLIMPMRVEKLMKK